MLVLWDAVIKSNIEIARVFWARLGVEKTGRGSHQHASSILNIWKRTTHTIRARPLVRHLRTVYYLIFIDSPTLTAGRMPCRGRGLWRREPHSTSSEEAREG